MNPIRRRLFVVALLLFAGSVSSAPLILNNMIVPHNQDESAFPASSATNRGAVLFGTDAGVLYMSPGDGGAWQPLAISGPNETVAASHLSAFFPGVVLAAGDVIAQSRFTAAATFTRLTTRIVTAGSDGAHTFTVDVFDLTTSAVVCVTGTITCNTAASSVGVACTGTVAIADDVQIRVNDASCTTTAPQMNIAAEYR